MAWIYLAESEESLLLSASGSNQSLIVKEIDTLKACCCQEWPIMTSPWLQFGMTYHRLEAPCYRELTSSTADSLAKTSALQEMEKAWSAYRRENPETVCFWESGIRRVAENIPNRVDKLKCLGNSVVPLQAKTAFKILMGIK